MECDGHADVAPPRMDEVDAVGYEFDNLIPAYVERCESKVVRIIGERWAIAISGTSAHVVGVFVLVHRVPPLFGVLTPCRRRIRSAVAFRTPTGDSADVVAHGTFC